MIAIDELYKPNSSLLGTRVLLPETLNQVKQAVDYSNIGKETEIAL